MHPRMIDFKNMRRNNPVRGLIVLGLASVLSAAGCNGDEDPGGDGDVVGDGDGTGGVGGAGDGDGDGDVVERWIVGGWFYNEETYTGYLTVVNDISSSGSIDLSDVHEFPGDMMYASPGDGTVFVGLDGEPTIQKWALSGDGELEMVDDLGLMAFGVTTALGGGRNVIQFVDDDTAYYFDNENFQAIEFSPETMQTTGETISFAGLSEESQWPSTNYIHRDGDIFIVTARYWALSDDTTTSLTRAAFINHTNGSVSYDDDTRCGDIAFQATDTEGNLYLGNHPAGAAWIATGEDSEGAPPPCLLRVNKGETEIDEDYFVDLGELSGGVVGGLYQGPEGHAYVYQYVGDPITADSWNQVRTGEYWALYTLELGNEEETYAEVPGLDLFAPYGDSFETTVAGESQHFLVGVNAEFSSGYYYKIVDPTDVEEGLTFPGYPGPAIAVK